MPVGETWGEPRPVESLRGAELGRPGLVFCHRGFLYRSTGEDIGHGGMGNAFLLLRRPVGAADGVAEQAVVGKVFHSEYLYQLRTDEVTQRDYAMVLRHAEALERIEHPNLLPLFASLPVADNYLTISPRMAGTLRQAISTHALTPRRRVELFAQALHGLDRLHRAGFVHRDVTLRNILVDDGCDHAVLFDFDLTLALAEVAHESYLSHYKGRIFGSPGYSVAPEVVDELLMERPITPRLDLYAVGGSLFALFSDELPYGPSEDMWSLLVRISEGIVFNGNSRIAYPAAVPLALRPIIEGCLERDPDARTADVTEVIAALERVLPELDGMPMPRARTARPTAAPAERLSAVHVAARDPALSLDSVVAVDHALAYHGYQIERAMGRVKEHPIFLAAPRPEMLAEGVFPDANTYPKIVTALSLRGARDRDEIVDLWLGGYLPILRQARQGLLTSLYRVVWDAERELLLLFSEYVDDARFGVELDRHDLTLREAFGLGYLLTYQVRRLHKRGLAHNNVCAASLLLKGVASTREVHPAMVGIVAPSFAEADMATDVRQLAGLVLSWLRPGRVDELPAGIRGRVLEAQAELDAVTRAEDPPPHIGQLLQAMSDGLAALDGNFAVLREHGGDLQAYALLLVSHSLYGRLWEKRA
jgi:serine/threonine protein kinase